MNRVTPSGVRIAVVGCMTAALTLGIGSCANPPTQVDPGYFPEGTFSPRARLIVWRDLPNRVQIWADLAPIGPHPLGDICGMPVPGLEDTLLATEEVRNFSPGTIRGMIIDGTMASGFQIFRSEQGGGYRQFQDFLAERFRQWLPSGWEVFRFVDRTPSGSSPAGYVGRGVVQGTVTPQSPLTNPGELAITSIPEVTLTSFRRPADSLFTISWAPVAGADGYWLQVYETPPIAPLEAMRRGAPSPLFDGDFAEAFTGFIRAPSTTYKIGDDTRTDVDVMIRRTTFFGRIYIARISAVDNKGQMIATTRGSNGLMLAEGTYALFPLGGVGICPTAPGSPLAPGVEQNPELMADGRLVWRVSKLPFGP